MTSDGRQRSPDSAPEPAAARPKTLTRPGSDAWRLELAAWSEDERFAWTERVAIMLADGRTSVEEAEIAAYLDGRKHRAAE
jgi:hypothetical protein